MTPLHRFGSLRTRITLVVTLLFALSLTAGLWFLMREVKGSLTEDIRATDLAELELLAATLYEPLGFTAFPYPDLIVSGVGVLPAGEDGTSYQVLDVGGELLASTPVFGVPEYLSEVPPEVLIELPPDLAADALGTRIGETPLEATTVTLVTQIGGQDVTLTATSSLEPVNASVGTLRGLLWIAVPLLVAAVALLAWLVVGRALQPVEAIAGQATRITGSNLHERVPVPAAGEIRHLAETVNAMLARIEDARGRQMRFVSDASHELRSPVATSSAKLQVALSYPEDVDWQATGRTVLAEQERLGKLVDDLLLLARIGEVPDQRRTEVDLDHVALQEAARVERVTIDTSGVAAGRVIGDPAQLSRAIGNLLDNAARHAAETIRLGVASAADEVTVTVDDDGPGIDPSERETVFDRFTRTEEARSRDDGGSGIGLAIVAAVAEAHQGNVAASDSDLGGARFTFTVPVAPSGD